jgi:hypothetical protein
METGNQYCRASILPSLWQACGSPPLRRHATAATLPRTRVAYEYLGRDAASVKQKTAFCPQARLCSYIRGSRPIGTLARQVRTCRIVRRNRQETTRKCHARWIRYIFCRIQHPRFGGPCVERAQPVQLMRRMKRESSLEVPGIACLADSRHTFHIIYVKQTTQSTDTSM